MKYAKILTMITFILIVFIGEGLYANCRNFEGRYKSNEFRYPYIVDIVFFENSNAIWFSSDDGNIDSLDGLPTYKGPELTHDHLGLPMINPALSLKCENDKLILKRGLVGRLGTIIYSKNSDGTILVEGSDIKPLLILYPYTP